MGKRLLVLGSGGHGKVAQEVALSILENGKRKYEYVGFLDDLDKNAVGKLDEMEKFKNLYDEVFCGIGNNKKRFELLRDARQLGFSIATLIHPTAYISSSAVIEEGVIVEPYAIVNTRAVIKKGAIISVGAIADHDVIIGEYAHVNAGSVCMSGSTVKAFEKVDAGEVKRNIQVGE